MKITTNELRNIIAEEVARALNEGIDESEWAAYVDAVEKMYVLADGLSRTASQVRANPITKQVEAAKGFNVGEFTATIVNTLSTLRNAVKSWQPKA